MARQLIEQTDFWRPVSENPTVIAMRGGGYVFFI
jgi:hypothetical protein